MAKSRDAFRTISEVAEWLDTPAHVLRFWESKFTQVKPVKRAGGRRYYRPTDMALLAGLKKLLHEDGLTIKGAQKILREKGVKHVAGLSELSLEDEAEETVEAVSRDTAEVAATVTPLAPVPPPAPPEPAGVEVVSDAAPEPAEDATPPEPVAPSALETAAAEPAEEEPEGPVGDSPAEPEPVEDEPADEPEEIAETETASAEDAAPEMAEAAEHVAPEDDGVAETEAEDDRSVIPFTPASIRSAESEAAETEAAPVADAEPETAAPAPLGADIPPDPTEDEIDTRPGPLTRIAGLARLDEEDVERLAPYLDALRARANGTQR